MLLPNTEKAIIQIEKLRDYCLCDTHPTGKYKARVFRIGLDLNDSDAEELKRTLQKGILIYHAKRGEFDKYGQRYTVDIAYAKFNKRANIRTAWIIKTGEKLPRLTSCYIK